METVSATKSKRDELIERYKQKYPDKEFVDDEALHGQTLEEFDEFDKKIANHQKNEETLSEMFSSDPRSATFLTEWKNGKDPVVQLIEIFGTDIVEAINDPTRREEIAEKNKKFLEKVAKEKEYKAEYDANIRESLTALQTLQEEKGLSDEQIDEVMEKFMDIITDGVKGKIEPATIEMLLKAMNYETDIETASMEGEVRGRNAQIDEKLRKKQKGDGMPQLGGRNIGGAARDNVPDLGALNKFGGGMQDIYERGGFKRSGQKR